MGYCCKKCGAIIDEGFTELDCPRGCFDEKETAKKYINVLPSTIDETKIGKK